MPVFPQPVPPITSLSVTYLPSADTAGESALFPWGAVLVGLTVAGSIASIIGLAIAIYILATGC